jgi:hypothetical protein
VFFENLRSLFVAHLGQLTEAVAHYNCTQVPQILNPC